MSTTSLTELGWAGFSTQLWERARRDCIPLNGIFELTPLCNFRCRMCYVRLDQKDMHHYGQLRTASEWLDLAQQAMRMGTYHVTLTGGEALTRPDFPSIYTGLVEMGLLVTVLSNGSLVTEKVVELFRTHQPRRLRITLYGASNETYRRLCGASNGFDRVSRSLASLREAGIPFSLAFTTTKENVDDLDAVLDIAESLGVGVVVSGNLFHAVRGATSEADSLRIPPSEAPRIERDIDNRRPDPISRALDAATTSQNLFAHCKAYRTSFWVDWNGHMETCSYMSSGGAEPFEEGFDVAWRRMHEHTAALRVPDECSACNVRAFCPVCPGYREAETGSPEGVPRHLCEEVRAWAARTNGTSSAKGGERP